MSFLHFRCTQCGRVNRIPDDRVAAKPKCGVCKIPIEVTNHPFYVSDDELDALIASSPVPVLVDFYADWCGPCRALGPTLEQLGKNNAGRLFIAKVDTEAHQRKAAELGVQGIPALFVFHGGRLVDQTAGARPLAAMQAFVNPHLG